MSHPESEHGLRVQLATALRERDTERDFRGAAEAAFAEQLAKTEAAESALAAAHAACDEQSRKLVNERNAANARADAANKGRDESQREMKHWQAFHAQTYEALAAARRETERLRERVKRLQRLKWGGYLAWDRAGGPEECPHGVALGIPCAECEWLAEDADQRAEARAALAYRAGEVEG